MLNALKNKFHIPKYLLGTIQDYLKDRDLVYDTQEGMRCKLITTGAAQGSILGPELWNSSYEDILDMEIPDDSTIIDFTDDVVVEINTLDLEEAQLILTLVMRRINFWMEKHSLSLSLHKTEIIILTTKRIETILPIEISNKFILTQKAIKYLGVYIDSKLNFKEDIRDASEKAASITGNLIRLMAKIKGPKPQKRKIFSVTQAIMLNAAVIIADTLKKEFYRKQIADVQRSAKISFMLSHGTRSNSLSSSR